MFVWLSNAQFVNVMGKSQLYIADKIRYLPWKRNNCSKLLIAAGVCASLSACVSSVSPVAQLNAVADDTRLDGNSQKLALINSAASDKSTASALKDGDSAPSSQSSNAITQASSASPGDGDQQLSVENTLQNIPIPVRNPVIKVAIAAQNADENTQSAQLKSGPNEDQTDAHDSPRQSDEQKLALVSEKSEVQSEEVTAAAQEAQKLSTINGIAAQKTVTENKKPGLFSFLFQRAKQRSKVRKQPGDDRASSILLSSRTASRSNRTINKPSTATLAAMPGVRSNQAIFEINKNKGKINNLLVASVAGLARLSVSKLRTQHSGVNVDCIQPEVLKILYVVERNYGKKPIVTSGYRNPSRNRRAGGARNSMHIYCKAVDIQVEGVSKWDLARFLRSVPGRGGVGTYCRTKSVHLDIGPKRDWHYACRRKSKRRRKA